MSGFPVANHSDAVDALKHPQVEKRIGFSNKLTKPGATMSTFDSTKTPLPDIIKHITEGKVQLPDFQRGSVWDDEHVRSLLVSVARPSRSAR